MKLKIGCTAPESTSRTPAVPRSADSAPSSASARPSGRTSIRRRRSPVGPDDHKKIDPERLARELEVDKCAVNSGRFWMMDEVEYAGRRHRGFSWCQDEVGGDMTGAEMMAQFAERLSCPH